MFSSISNKFGGRDIQNRIQRRGHSEGLAGRRGTDPQVHATSRPWHTSTAGIHMSVGLQGQVSGQSKASKYLNQMKLTELAQKKRGNNSDPANADMTGRDSIRGLKGSVATSRSNRPPQGSLGPSQDTIDRWQRSIEGQATDIEKRFPAIVGAAAIAPGAPGGPAAAIQAQTSLERIGGLTAANAGFHYKAQYEALRGQMAKLKKMNKPHGYF